MEKTMFHTQTVKKKLCVLLVMILFLPMGSFTQVFTKPGQSASSPFEKAQRPTTGEAVSNTYSPAAKAAQQSTNPFASTSDKNMNSGGEDSAFPTLRTDWPDTSSLPPGYIFKDYDAGVEWRWTGDRWDRIGSFFVPVGESLSCLMILSVLYVGFTIFRKRNRKAGVFL
jgi:hypothetical protein